VNLVSFWALLHSPSHETSRLGIRWLDLPHKLPDLSPNWYKNVTNALKKEERQRKESTRHLLEVTVEPSDDVDSRFITG
jgi:hypothetical protein